jgi:phosphatidylinositol alpha-1,6-mannosyltransferase
VGGSEDRLPAAGATVTHLLVTNDFPPKVGGIQSYLGELWRRLPPEETVVLTTPHQGAAAFDAEQPYRIERTREPVLLPSPPLGRRIDRLADEVGAGIVVLDPALPLGLIGRHLRHRYAVIAHGAEITVPGRLPPANLLLRSVMRNATHLIAAGGYPAAESRRAAGRDVPTTIIPPGVDVERFRPLSDDERAKARASLGLPVDGRIVVSVSRLVPRKGMDVLIEAAALLAPGRTDLTVAIAGGGRDRSRLDRLVVRTGAPVRLLGRVADDDLPALYGCADVFVMLCRNRWLGLEQEGFGIVFVEAAACGVPQVAGDSGGAAEAVAEGSTGFVVRDPRNPGEAAAAIARLLDDAVARRRMGEEARRRTVEDLSYDVLARRLDNVLRSLA